MAERSQFWQTGTTGDGAAAITEAQTTEWFRDLITPRSDSNAPSLSQGILRGVLGELAITGASSPLSVAAGAAAVEGYYYKNDSAASLVVPTPAGSTRIDRIVLRVSHGTTRTVRITRIAGTEGAGAPAITQTAGTTWDIPLAQLSITTGGVITLTDQRTYAQLATNHVKRDGDTMTGPLTVPSLTATGAIAAASATVSGAAAVGSLTVGGVAPWTSANDGSGSGLDADLIKGVDHKAIQRQGGSAVDWSSPGTNNYNPVNLRECFGVVATGASGLVTITFPTAFSNKPVVLLTPTTTAARYAVVNAISASTVTMRCYDAAGSPVVGEWINWLAKGPA